MSRLLKHRKKDDKWRLWSTISDQWVTDWLSKDEMKAAVAEGYELDYMLKIIELYWSFPHGCYDKDISFSNGRPFNKTFNNWDAYQAFTKWNLEATRSDDYFREVEKKFKELTGEVA